MCQVAERISLVNTTSQLLHTVITNTAKRSINYTNKKAVLSQR